MTDPSTLDTRCQICGEPPYRDGFCLACLTYDTRPTAERGVEAEDRAAFLTDQRKIGP